MNGAQALFKTFIDAGLEVCFANPGTSEMQLVYEMGLTKEVRPVLCLQENTVTGAADGYERMAGKPAFTLLHVGSGFANGIANLHNAGRANTMMVNVVGANATYHQPNFPEHRPHQRQDHRPGTHRFSLGTRSPNGQRCGSAGRAGSALRQDRRREDLHAGRTHELPLGAGRRPACVCRTDCDTEGLASDHPGNCCAAD